MQVRDAHRSELEALARLWLDAWRDGHAAIVPPALLRHRTVASFRERMRAVLPEVRVVGPLGAPIGFCLVEADELSQLFVAARARGTGVADALTADAEARLAAAGVETAWLMCAVGNDRAARFYERAGWRRAGSVLGRASTPEGTLEIESWRFEKRLR